LNPLPDYSPGYSIQFKKVLLKYAEFFGHDWIFDAIIKSPAKKYRFRWTLLVIQHNKPKFLSIKTRKKKNFLEKSSSSSGQPIFLFPALMRVVLTFSGVPRKGIH
jgi:hypothetical protein